MKGLKSLMAVSALLIAGSAMGQDYNRVGISYNCLLCTSASTGA